VKLFHKEFVVEELELACIRLISFSKFRLQVLKLFGLFFSIILAST
jgi:hypothetical protein